MDENAYKSALAAVEHRIARAALAAGRDRADIELLAVSKTHPPAAVRALYSLGLRTFGENYAQELAAKAAALQDLPGLSWSFVGTVQSNKLKLLVTHASEIQAVTSLDQARKIARLARELNKIPFSIYLGVNAGDEATKHGAPLADAPRLADEIQAGCPELRLRGIMAIPPPLAAESPAAPVARVPPLYARLAGLAATIGEGRLSLGMTADLEPAIAAGSTCVRIGTALFGAREKILGVGEENPL